VSERRSIYRFDPSGKLIDRELRLLSTPAERNRNVYAIYDALFQERLAEQIADWQSELGFTEEPIAVEPFYDDEQQVGIELPESKSCASILWWAKEYWMDSEGHVEST
jgi:hypothetical protein